MDDITPAQRAASWNVVFLDDRDEVFAGFYHDVTKLALKFANALQELNGFNLTFGCDGKVSSPEEWCWVIWPALDYASHGASTASSDLSEPHTPSMDMIIPPGRYYLLIHDKKCILNHWGLVTGRRLKASGCVSFVMKCPYAYPTDYRPPLPIARPEYKATFNNGLQGSKTAWVRHTSGGTTSTVPAPRPDGVGMDIRLSAINGWNFFSKRARSTNGCCAITGLGRAPLEGKDRAIAAPAPGFMLEAYHIVPPEYFSIYPVGSSTGATASGSRGSVPAAFDQIWTPAKNAILLLPHIYGLFRARLIAVHPETLRIRTFSPCELVDQYNGSLAKFGAGCEPDREALRWHWNMCVIENVTAKVSLPPSLRLHSPAAALHPGAGKISDDNLQFCTQKCLRGLKYREDFDDTCPNYRLHVKLPQPINLADEPGCHAYIGQDKWAASPAGKLVWSNHPGQPLPKVHPIPEKFGDMVHLVRIVLEGGYVLVGKGTRSGQRFWLAHEHAVYRRLEALQGAAVTTCLGLVRLEPPLRYTCAPALDSVLLLAWVGGAVAAEAGLSPAALGDHVRRSSEEVARCGVRHARKEKHLLWSEEVQRVMVIDFGKDRMDPLR